jgi:hypothetical protein
MLIVRRFLDEVFPNRSIGIEWPARSPHITSLDFFKGDISSARSM